MSSGGITLEEVLVACERAGMVCEPVTASEVGEELGCTRRTALNKLDELAERGDIESKKVGARSRVWWRPPGRSSVREQNGADDASESDSLPVEGSVADTKKRLEAEFEEVFGRISDAFYALDDQWRFTHVNDRAEELIDYHGEGLVGKNFWEVFEWADDSTLGEEYRTAMETQEPTSFEFYYPDPLDAWYEVHAYPSKTGLSVYFQDVTERKERERELEEYQSRYQTLVENFPNGAVALVDRDLRYVTFGGTPESDDVTRTDLEGSNVSEGLPEELADVVVPHYEAALDGETATFEERVGDEVYQFHFLPVRDDDGEIFAALGMSQDVTERKESQRQLEESERRFEALVDHFPNGAVGLFNEDLRYMVAGGDVLEDVDTSTEDIVGKTVWERYPEEIAAQLEPKFRAALEGEKNRFEVEFHDRDWLAHTVPVSDDTGNVFAGMILVQDITERKERERNLREAKTQLEAAAEAGAVGTWEWRIPEDEMVTGASFARTFGVDPDEARDGVSLDRFIDAIHDDDRPRVERKIERAVETCGEYEAEYRVQNTDGEWRWVVARGHVECDDEGNPVTFPGALADITKRKHAELELEEHRRQLEALFEVLPVGVVVADADGELLEANATAEEIWGHDAFDAESIADYEQYRGWWVDTGDPVDPEEWTMARVLDGEEVTDPDIFEIETADGERRILMVHGMPVRDDAGDVDRGVVTQTDITERREYQEQLEKSNERLESFASMLAHELRNPVTIGQIYSEQLPTNTDDKAVKYVTEAFDRIEDTIDVMLVLTRGREALGERTTVEFTDVIAEAWTDVDAPEATLEVQTDGTIQADGTYVRHFFRNLFENAVEHGGNDVTVTVGELPTGFYVADDGVGIPVEDRDAVFEMGFTTAAEDGGTGLGLAFVRELAEMFGWEYSVTESADGGARFEFTNVDQDGPRN